MSDKTLKYFDSTELVKQKLPHKLYQLGIIYNIGDIL